MKKHLLAMASAAVLGLATSGPGSAGAIQFVPGLGSAVDSNVIQVQRQSGAVGAREPGQSNAGRGDARGGSEGRSSQRSNDGQRGRMQGGNTVQFQDTNRGSRASIARRGNDRVERRGNDRVERRGHHRVVRRGWSRDRRHAFYGAVLIGVPYGYATYASHPCYDWVYGPQGPGYYWNYDRCPV